MMDLVNRDTLGRSIRLLILVGIALLCIDFRVLAQTPEITLQNLDKVPFNDRLAFSRIGRLAAPPGNGMHERGGLRIQNTGSADLIVNSLTITGPDASNFAVENGPALPLTITGGSFRDLTVRFRASSVRKIHRGNLTIGSNDPDDPNLIVQLAGFWQNVSEGGVEPDLQQIVDIFGYQTDIAGSGELLANNGLIEAIGDEILSPYWKRANTSLAVHVRQLAAYHTYPSQARIYWHYKGRSTTSGIVQQDPQDAQTVLPRKTGLSGPVENWFSPSTSTAGGVFGFKIDSEWSDPARNDRQTDVENGCLSPNIEDCGHRMRFFQAKDRDGNVMNNSYIVVMDYSGINYDYNDNVYLISNIQPEVSVPGFFEEAGGQVVFEVENFHGKVSRSGHNWVKKDTTGDVATSMFAFPNTNLSIDSNLDSNSPELKYNVFFSTTGTYYIWARVRVLGHDDNSWHVGVNGSPVGTSDRMESRTFNQWTWSRSTMDGSPATISVNQSGERTINIWMREDGVYLDRILLTTNSGFTPVGTGPAESDRINLSMEFAGKDSEANLQQIQTEATPGSFVLEGNYPNPFNPLTTIRYRLPAAAEVRLEVFDSIGRRVAVLVDGVQEAGTHDIPFNATDFPSGFYVYRIQAGDQAQTGKMILVK